MNTNLLNNIVLFLYIRTMNHLFCRDNRLILLSAVLFALSLIVTQFYLAWLCLCPLFVVLQERKGKAVFYKGALFGWITGLLLFYWLIPVVTFFYRRQLVFGITYLSGGAGFFGIVFRTPPALFCLAEAIWQVRCGVKRFAHCGALDCRGRTARCIVYRHALVWFSCGQCFAR